jgi:uncharacterized membrane protein YkvA (DUF1232 family)
MRIAQISDLHINDPFGSGLAPHEAFADYMRRALPDEKSAKLLIAFATDPSNSVHIARIIKAIPAVVRGGKKGLTSVPGLTLSGLALLSIGAAVFHYRRELLEFHQYYFGGSDEGQAQLLAQLAAVSYDHLLITGDITCTAHPAEFAAARAYIDRITSFQPNASITIIPGNHDVVTGAADAPPDLSNYYDALGDLIPHQDPNRPTVQDIDGLSIYGLNSCTSGVGLGITGTVGATQLNHLSTLLKHEDRARHLIAVHHHVTDYNLHTKVSLPPLSDANALYDTLEGHDIVGVFCGHTHTEYAATHRGHPLFVSDSSTKPRSTEARAAQQIRLFEVGQRGGATRITNPSSELVHHYTEGHFWSKVQEQAKTAGFTVIQQGLSLYYTMADSNTPRWAKAIIAAALGYFILPSDAIPDVIAIIGFSDDLSVLLGAASTVANHTTEKHKRQASEKINTWFSDNDD